MPISWTMESYPSLSSASGKLNYQSNMASSTTTTTTSSGERKMPLSRSLTQPQGTIEYMVTSHDTLNSVAARFQTTPSELARINKIIGRYIFSGQIIFVPKRNSGNEKGSSIDVPPNTPNDVSSRNSSNSDSTNLDSPVPGHAQRVVVENSSLLPAGRDNHQLLHQTCSSPISTMHGDQTDGATELATIAAAATASEPAKVASSQIDPADRECLERFLKISVRHITDGQGVVTGVLLVTPNALMFDPGVSDPLVIEHGTEMYGVTVPMELVLKAALYTDIAHMRVKHAPEAVPAVPKPAVYYASDEDASCIFEENIRNAYATKSAVQFDTIGVPSEEPTQTSESRRAPIAEKINTTEEKLVSPRVSCETNASELSGDNVICDSAEKLEEDIAKDEETFEDAQENVPESDPNERVDEAAAVTERRIKEEPSIDLTETIDSEIGSFDQNRSEFNVSIDTTDEEKPLSMDALGSSPQQSNRLSSYFQTKLALSERHSAPLSGNGQRVTPPPLVTAVSAEESNDLMINKRRSAHGESRREQMLKRLSNPVDTLGSITKSGFNSSINATKKGFSVTTSGISTGLNATKSGISTGILATKSGLTTGLSATKTGFNKVLSTPKNLMDLSSNLVRDAKGAKACSKSDYDLSSRTQESAAGYMNMVDTKVDAFENFDKLIPRPAKHSKDPPLYLCIRMGKHKKVSKKGQRFSPTYSFGRKKYEREYWFSVPKEKSSNLYHFFQKWAPEIYGDVDNLHGCEARGLEPITTDDELEAEEFEEEPATTEETCEKSSEDKENDSQKLNVAGKSKFWRRRSPLHFLRMVEDHFSQETSSDWNISNSSEEHSFAERFGLEPSEPIMPDIHGHTELLTADIIRNLSKHLPARAEGYAWSLIYSTSQHGFSLNSLYREMKRFDSPVLLIIEDTNGAIFGALLSNSLQQSDHFYGTGETFLFTFFPEFACYPWTGENLFFIKGNVDSVSVGAGEGNFGLWLDGDLYHGSSHPCKTFGNQTLSSAEDFVVKSIECWGFV